MPTNSKEYMKKNYKKYWGNPKAVRDRSLRNQARRKMMKAGRVRKWDGKEVDHRNGIAGWNGNNNLRVISRTLNRRLWAAKANRFR